jgi:mannosylglycerate hydrolase MGH1-like protein
LGTTELQALCERVLDESWVDGERKGVAFGYTRPSPGRYDYQWYLDSCLTAIVRRRFRPERARTELESLLAAARPDGFIGHTIFWTPLRGARLAFYNVASPRAHMTATIQPPLLPWAWRIAVGDPAADGRIARHHEAVARERDLDGDGLLWLLQPDESGLDASPQFDAIWGRRMPGRPLFPLLVRRNRRLGFDIRRVVAAGRPVVCEVLTNVLHGLSALALERPSITPRLVERLYDEDRGLFLPEARNPCRPHSEPVETIAALTPLALPDLPEEIGRRLVEEHLLDPGRFWSELPPPSVSLREPSFSRKDTRLGLRRYWRGPTWVNTAWLCWMGMLRLGYDEPAAQLAERLLATVRREGLREYYDPFTGAGMGAEEFAWSALAVELLEPGEAARASYLSPSGCS